MNLNQKELEELNHMLKSSNLDLPSFRREVRSCGTNYEWLQKNLTKRNTGAPARLKQLLGIKIPRIASTEVEGG